MEYGRADTLVMKDQAGVYYLLPWEALQQSRVPAEHMARIERLIAEQHDVQGHAIPVVFLLACSVISLGAELVIGFSGEWEARGGRGPQRPL